MVDAILMEKMSYLEQILNAVTLSIAVNHVRINKESNARDKHHFEVKAPDIE